MDFKGSRKGNRKGRPYSVKIYTLYHVIEIKNKLNKKKEHLWEVPTLKKSKKSYICVDWKVTGTFGENYKSNKHCILSPVMFPQTDGQK